MYCLDRSVHRAKCEIASTFALVPTAVYDEQWTQLLDAEENLRTSLEANKAPPEAQGMRLEAVDLACEPEFAFTQMGLGGMPEATPLPRADGVALPARQEVPSFKTLTSSWKLARNPPAAFPRKTAVNIRGVGSIHLSAA